MKRKRLTIEIYKVRGKRSWNWRIKINGRVIASAYGYDSKRNALRAFYRVSSKLAYGEYRFSIQ